MVGKLRDSGQSAGPAAFLSPQRVAGAFSNVVGFIDKRSGQHPALIASRRRQSVAPVIGHACVAGRRASV